MLHISKRVEYALRAAIYLASQEEGAVVSFKDIASRQNVPKDFMAKILRSLVDAQILRSVRGAGGGFALARGPKEITFLDIIIATEGPIALNDCCDAGDGCEQIGACTMESVWQRAELAMLSVLRQTTLDEVIARHQHLPLSEALPAQ